LDIDMKDETQPPRGPPIYVVLHSFTIHRFRCIKCSHNMPFLIHHLVI